MNALLRRFVELLGAEMAAAGFVRRGPVFRHLDSLGNGVVLDIQRTHPMWGQVEFFINVGVVLGLHLRFYFGEADPSRDVRSYHGVWQHRLTTTGGYHQFSLSSEADVDGAVTVVRDWLAVNLPRLMSWNGDFDAMLAAMKEDREQG